MKKTVIDVGDYGAVFGLISLIPLHDGSLMIPMWASLVLIGFPVAARVTFFLGNRFFN